MATSSFFYGDTPSPEANTVDQLIDSLNQKLQEAEEIVSTADASATSSAASAASAANSATTASGAADAALISATTATDAANIVLSNTQAAADSAAAAAISETNAASSASSASGSASAASVSATNALNSENATATLYDQFDDRYLGSKASDPTLDNDGNALLTGALYFNSTAGNMRVYNGAAWVIAYLPSSTYLEKDNNLSDVADIDTARANLSALEYTATTGSAVLPKGTTAQRDAVAVQGYLRFNEDTDEFEGYNGTAWASVGGSAITNDTSTSTDVYPLFANATSGTAANVYTSNAKYLYKPSTGELKAQELVATNGIVVNSQTVSADYTIPSGSNAMSVGATVASGVTVTVSSGSTWVIL